MIAGATSPDCPVWAGKGLAIRRITARVRAERLVRAFRDSPLTRGVARESQSRRWSQWISPSVARIPPTSALTGQFMSPTPDRLPATSAGGPSRPRAPLDAAPTVDSWISHALTVIVPAYNEAANVGDT